MANGIHSFIIYMASTTNDDNKTCKLLKVTPSDIAVSNQPVSEGYTSVLRFTSTRVILNNAFRFFLGSQSLEDFIIDTIKSFLAHWFDCEPDGTVRIKGAVAVESITVDGDANVKNLKVERNTTFEGDATASGMITAYGGFTGVDPSRDP